ncbi:MAG: SAM-dependent methyltransferase, partial [Candidatus Hydrogenedentes bacterium]|nr:SAM-dependent methyltransferase [Candidatus Hydrogenedentota bacterium]
KVASFVAPGGRVLIVARGRDAHEPEGSIPWPLTREELQLCTLEGLVEESFEDYVEEIDPPVRRFRVVYARTR